MGWADDIQTQFDPNTIFGTSSLPPPPDGASVAMRDARDAAASAPGGPGPSRPGLAVPVGPPAADGTAPPPPAGQGGAWGGMPPEIAKALSSTLAPKPQPSWLSNVLGVSPDSAGRFMSSLGAGLSSAGQNWNKPAMAAFASGAGAAIQGGDKAHQQLVHNRIAALNAAIHAYRAGDMAQYHKSLAEYHEAIAQLRRRQAAPAKPALDAPAVNGAGEPPAIAAPAAEAPDAAIAPEAEGEAAAQPAAPDPQALAGHRATLSGLLAEAGAPPHRIDVADIDGAARLMAAKTLPAPAAFETATLHDALERGHLTPAEVDLIYGKGAADAIRASATS